MKPLTIKDKIQVILVMILSAMLSFTVVIDLMQGSSKNYFILEFILVLFLSALSQSRQFGINGIVHYVALRLVGLTFLLKHQVAYTKLLRISVWQLLCLG